MLQRLSHWFIPAKANQHHPHILRPIGLISIALVLAFIPSFYNYSTRGTMQVLGYATDISIGGLHETSNAQRVNNGVAPLALNGQLNQAALAKAQHMFANNYWAHTAPDGTTPWAFINGSGFAYTVAGENLAKNFSTSSGVVDGWMNSPSHRNNILKNDYDSVGYAAVNGTLQGIELTVVVALYARAYVAPTPAPTPPPAPSPAAVSVQNTAAPQVAESPQIDTPAAEVPQEATPAESATEAPEVVVRSDTRQTTTEASSESTEIREVTTADVAGAVVTAPIKAYVGLNWGQKTSLFILSIMMLLYILKHTIVWRAKKKGVAEIWMRSHPLAQASCIGIAITVTLVSGAGSVL